MSIRKLAAAVIAGAALVGAAAVATPAGATGSSQPASIVAALAASAANNPQGSATDGNWNDLDILLAASQALPFDAVGNPEGPKIVDALTGFTGTVFAPADAAFRGLVADLTNTPIWKLDEAAVLNALLTIAAEPNLNNTGVSGLAALSETVSTTRRGPRSRTFAGRRRAAWPRSPSSPRSACPTERSRSSGRSWASSAWPTTTRTTSTRSGSVEPCELPTVAPFT